MERPCGDLEDISENFGAFWGKNFGMILLKTCCENWEKKWWTVSAGSEKPLPLIGHLARAGAPISPTTLPISLHSHQSATILGWFFNQFNHSNNGHPSHIPTLTLICKSFGIILHAFHNSGHPFHDPSLSFNAICSISHYKCSQYTHWSDHTVDNSARYAWHGPWRRGRYF